MSENKKMVIIYPSPQKIKSKKFLYVQFMTNNSIIFNKKNYLNI